jgi:hydrogenase small subunit
MKVTRRDFLKYCGVSAAALGLTATELGRLEEILANPSAPTVLWLQGSGCTGCSVSLLNRISTSDPKTVADLLIKSVNLAYHPNLMSLAGQSAAEVTEQAYNKGGYILVVEGGVPTALNGAPCFAWTYNGVDVTFQEAVNDLASRASKIICVGDCASWGGMSGAPPNPTGVKGVKAVTGKTTINIAGCPPHPDWIVWPVVQILLGKTISVDSSGRPKSLYGRSVHDSCPREDEDETKTIGVSGRCLKELGCRGPDTRANCPSVLWNNRANWCIDSNAPCIGCTQPTFPGTASFYKNIGRGGGGASSDTPPSDPGHGEDDERDSSPTVPPHRKRGEHHEDD